MSADELPPPPRPLSSVLTSAGSDAASQRESAELLAVHGVGRIDGFELLGVLGRGGMGVVYKARQVSLSRIVALKMLLAGPHASPEELARFREEATTLAQLSHPHIVQIYDVGEHDGHTYCALEYVEGGCLADRLRNGPLPVREAAEMVNILAQAVQVIHECGIIHRDLKPANVLLTTAGQPKITDFGLIRSLNADERKTQSGAVLGTPSYMAPEQARGSLDEIGPATDVHALGAILYESLTGRPPFLAATSWETVQQAATSPPVPPRKWRRDTPARLEEICLTCLQKQPAQRYQTAQSLAHEIQHFLDRTGDQDASAARQLRAPKPWARVVVGLIVLAVFLSAFPLATRFRHLMTPNGETGDTQSRGASATIQRANGPLGRITSQDKSPETTPELVWRTLTPITVGESFDRLAFPNPHVGYAAGRRFVYRTNDRGEHWQRLWKHDLGRILVLTFADPETGWMGSADRLLFSADGGQHWEDVTLPGPSPLGTIRALACMPWGDRLAGGSRADGGLVLFRQSSPTGAWEELKLALGDGQDAAVFSQSLVAQITPWGASHIALVLFSGEDEGGAVLVADSEAREWNVRFRSDRDLYCIAAVAGHGWLAGSGGTLWKTDDDGQSWTVVPHPAESEITVTRMHIDPTGSLGLAPLWKGRVLQLSNAEWREAQPPGFDEYSLPDVVVVDSQLAYVLGGKGVIARYGIP